MTDVQVSNERRTIFTALAVVAFWVLSWQAYRFGMDYEFLADDKVVQSVFGYELDEFITDYRYAVIGLTHAAVPTAFLMLSAGNSLLRLRTPSLILCGLLIAICASFSCWLGEEDMSSSRPVVPMIHDLETGTYSRVRPTSYLWEYHVVSWFWLLLPIILTTAFVIFGAWRRAVRDAEVEEGGEDE